MSIIAIASQKGGTGKTTTTVNLGHEISQEASVLVVDFDPQSNLTSGLGINPYEPHLTIYNALQKPSLTSDVLIEVSESLHLLPASLDLADAEYHLSKDMIADQHGWLRNVLKRLSYDYILIDCPPSLGFFTLNAFFAAEEILVPMQCEPYSLAAMRQLAAIVDRVQRRHDIGWRGIALTMYDRRVGLTEAVEQEARSRFGDLVYSTTIPKNVAIAEASAVGQPVVLYDKHSTGAKAYKALAQEVLNG